MIHRMIISLQLQIMSILRYSGVHNIIIACESSAYGKTLAKIARERLADNKIKEKKY